MAGSVTNLIGQLQSDDSKIREEAAAAIWNHYCNVLLALANQNLSERLRRRVGPDDVVQHAFKSFFLRQQRGQYDLADRQDLLHLLIRITLNKARGAAHRESRKRRDYRRDETTPVDGDSDVDAWLVAQIETGGPTPDVAAALADEAEERLATLPDDLRRIALSKLEGHTNAEIAALPENRCSIRTVERKLRLIREAWDSSS
jgi:RNA polymerase sigma-70 factor (ECF subfamily)